MIGKDRCEFLPKKDDEGAMLDARDAVLVSYALKVKLTKRQVSRISRISYRKERRVVYVHTMPPGEL